MSPEVVWKIHEHPSFLRETCHESHISNSPYILDMLTGPLNTRRGCAGKHHSAYGSQELADSAAIAENVRAKHGARFPGSIKAPHKAP